VRAREGTISLWQVLAAVEAGTVPGASLLYLVAARGGRGVVARYGRFIGLRAAHLDRAAAQLRRRGALAVVLGRLLPGLRVVTAIACGVPRVPFRVFLPAMSLGGLGYIVAYTLLGYWAGPTALGLVERLHLPIGLLGSGVPLLLLAGLVLVRRRLPQPLPRPSLRPWRRARVGLAAGAVATGSALLTLNVVVILAGDLAWRAPGSRLAEVAGRLSLALARDAAGGLLWLVVPMVVGVGWGGPSAAWAEPRRAGPDAGRGLLFALLPFLVGGGSLAPLPAQVEDATRLAPVALLPEAARQGCFGLTLGLAYPVLRARHRPDPAREALDPRRPGPPGVSVAAPARS
jgi:membrane protein DedA with SNARE-associated domain